MPTPIQSNIRICDINAAWYCRTDLNRRVLILAFLQTRPAQLSLFFSHKLRKQWQFLTAGDFDDVRAENNTASDALELLNSLT